MAVPGRPQAPAGPAQVLLHSAAPHVSRAGRGVHDAGISAGAAMWSAPGRARPGWRDLVRLVPVVPYLTGLGRDAPEAARLLSAVDAARPQEPHWYLATWGPTPIGSARGVGSALLQSVLDGVDAEGLPAYLESSKESNLVVLRPPRLRGDGRDPHAARRPHAVVDVEEGAPPAADGVRAGSARAAHPLGMPTTRSDPSVRVRRSPRTGWTPGGRRSGLTP